MTMSAKDVEQYRQDLKNKNSGGGGAGWFSMKPDTTVYIRIGPPWVKDGEIWKDSLRHRIPSKEMSNSNQVYCGHNDVKKDGTVRKCAVCRARKKMSEAGGKRTTASRALYGMLCEQTQSIYNVLVGKKVKILPSGKVLIKSYEDDKFKPWTLSPSWHGELLEIFTEDEYRRKSVKGVTSPQFGWVIRVKRIGKGLDTEYKFKVVGPSCPISKDPEKREALLKTLNNLDKIVRGSSDEELQAYVRLAEKKSRSLKDKEEDEEEPEDDDDDDDLDGEIEEESKKHKKKKKKSDDDEEEEKEEVEEDDEDEDE